MLETIYGIMVLIDLPLNLQHRFDAVALSWLIGLLQKCARLAIVKLHRQNYEKQKNWLTRI